MILDSIKGHPETLKAVQTAIDEDRYTFLHNAILYNNTEIVQNTINFFSPEEALELLLMTDNNGNTVFDRINASNSPSSLIQLSSIGAGYTYVHINNEDELSSKAVFFASAAFIVVNRPDLKKQIPKEHQNKIISSTEKKQIEDMIRSMSFSDHVTDAKVLKETKLLPELTNIIAEYTTSTIEQLKFWECLRKVPYHQNKATYEKRLNLAKLIIECNLALKKGMPNIPERFIKNLNSCISSSTDKEWNPRAWYENFGYKIPVQSTSSNPEEEKQLVPLTDFFNQPANDQAEEKKEDDNTTNSTMPALGSSSHQ